MIHILHLQCFHIINHALNLIVQPRSHVDMLYNIGICIWYLIQVLLLMAEEISDYFCSNFKHRLLKMLQLMILFAGAEN